MARGLRQQEWWGTVWPGGCRLPEDRSVSAQRWSPSPDRRGLCREAVGVAGRDAQREREGENTQRWGCVGLAMLARRALRAG